MHTWERDVLHGHVTHPGVQGKTRRLSLTVPAGTPVLRRVAASPSTGAVRHKPAVAPQPLRCRLLLLRGKSQNRWGWRCLWRLPLSHLLLEAGSATAGCPQPVPGGF